MTGEGPKPARTEESATQIVRAPNIDQSLASAFAALHATVEIGNRRFPTLATYKCAIASHEAANVWPDTARLVAAAQRDWHIRGQSGCQFARLAALRPAETDWEVLVASGTYNKSMPSHSREIGEAIEDCIFRKSEIISILFPGLAQAGQLLTMVADLCDHTPFWLERDEDDEHGRRIALRYPIASGVQAWVMIFGPFSFLPRTRQSPLTEVVLRAAEKPENIFHRLNHDRQVAHLADIPLQMPDKHWEHRWRSTQRRTAMILGGAPDSVSAAKSTLTIPHQLNVWDDPG